MYQVIEIKRYERTRDVILKNEKSGTEDICFDDSEIFGDEGENFSFMKKGGCYDCRIMLFGGTEPNLSGTKVHCQVLREDVSCGQAHYAEVRIRNDVYYISRKRVEKELVNGSFYFYYTRKDLIQVDDVMNRRCLLPMH